MMNWNENNFLERLMPYLKPGDRGGAGACPDPETLNAFSEGTLASKNRNAVQVHLDGCHACGQLFDRLKDFGTSSVPLSEDEWRNTEKRLNNWMQTLLKPGSTLPSRSSSVQHVYIWWNPKGWLSTPTLGYALAGTLGLALVVGIAVSGLRRQGEHSQVGSTRHQGTAPSSETTQTGTNSISSGIQRKKVEGLQEPNSTASIAPTAIAKSAMPKMGPLRKDEDIVRLKGEPWQTPLSAISPQTSPPDQGFSALREVRIQAGSGILLVVDSVTSQPGGHFSFKGHLSQPLVQDDKTVLPTSSLVVASGLVFGGETSLWVSEIQVPDIGAGTQSVVRESSYVLKATAVQPNVRFSSPLPGGRLAPGETLEARFVISSNYLHAAHPSPRVWEVPKQR